jgi:PLD-like domain
VAQELKVKHLLEEMSVSRKRDLCRERELAVGGNKNELGARLARSYRGDVAPLIANLTRPELIHALERIYYTLKGQKAEFVYLGQARREDLQEIARRVYGDNWEPETTTDELPVPSGCDVRLRWIAPETVDDGRDGLLTTQYAAAGFSALNIGALKRELQGATALSFASAYYDSQFFSDLLLSSDGSFEHLRSVRIVVNGLAGARLNAQTTDLSKIQSDLMKRFEDVEIRVVFARSIFHTKLYLIRKRRSQVALIGSANATSAAMSDNEEILLRLTENTSRLEAYFEHVWDHEATALDERQGLVKTLINFFRTGRIYFKTSATFQMTINPFSELLRELPNAEIRMLTNVSLRFSEPKAGVGPFALKSALGLNEADEDVLEKQENDGHRSSIKPYSVETCFGYWVPDAVSGDLNRILESASAGKRNRFGRIVNAFNRTSDATLAAAYSEYLDDARNLFSALPSVSTVIARLPSSPFESQASFATRVSQFRKNLANEDYVRRLCIPFGDTVMPEIWGDPVAYEEFKTSFFGYLSYVSGLPTKGSVPKQILKQSRCAPRVADPDEIQKGLTHFLRETGWHDQDDWPLK